MEDLDYFPSRATFVNVSKACRESGDPELEAIAISLAKVAMERFKN
eukprot:CAMPEP_0198154232 /NCGR_PEP_ID=MMETSP1443-20131203/67821_1 /TAXON_ID=186043 /ORGANISM="Entomoneis sp., Strain CCMP2396" /LENGTH=45 /DNA_ID= /DNA_START= /DNA_END= /DNA_ORIENTATION=